MNKSSSPKTQPKWWSPKSALWLGLVFVGLATLPYLFSAGKLISRGENLTVESLQKETLKDYKKGESEEKKREVRAFAVDASGQQWLGNKMGLYNLKNTAWQLIADYPGDEVKSLAVAADGALIVVDKHKVYERASNGSWSTSLEEESHNLTASGDGLYLIMNKGGGVMRRVSTGKWEKFVADLVVESNS